MIFLSHHLIYKYEKTLILFLSSSSLTFSGFSVHVTLYTFLYMTDVDIIISIKKKKKR